MSDPQSLVQERLRHKTWGLLGGQGHILGLDVGSYGLRAALIDLAGHSYAAAHTELSSDLATPDAIVDATIALARGLMSRQGATERHLVRAGVGFSGPVDARHGRVILSPRLAGWENYPLKDRIEEAFGATALVDNDANLIALAEATFGVGRQASSLFYLHLSSGVGGGLVLNHRLYHGATTTAGEVGHAVIGQSSPDTPDLAPSTLEQRVSIKGLLRRSAALGLETNLLSDLFGANPIGRQVVAEAVDLLAMRLSQIVALIDPQMIVVGGAVARSGGEAFLAAIQARMQHYMAANVRPVVPLHASVLGPESVAIGGVALALESMTD